MPPYAYLDPTYRDPFSVLGDPRLGGRTSPGQEWLNDWTDPWGAIGNVAKVGGLVSPFVSQLFGAGGGPMPVVGYGIGTLLPIAMDLVKGNLAGGYQKESNLAQYADAVQRYRVAATNRAIGASTFDKLGSTSANEDVKTNLELSSLGLNDNPTTWANIIAHGTGKGTKGRPDLVSDYLGKAPELAEKNWQSYLDYMDAAANRNINMTPEGYKPATKPEDFGTAQATALGNPYYEPTYKAPLHAFNPYDPNAAISAAEDYFHLPGEHHRAGGGLADLALGNTTPGAGGGVFSDEELANMGFTPGHYQEAMKNYLLARDPSLADNPAFQSMLGPSVARGNLTQAEMDANDQAYAQQMELWKKNLIEQKNLWDQEWQRQAAELQRRWTGGGG